MADVTAIILTKNEEKNLRDCLLSVAGFCSRAVVVDCGSTDRTVEIARELGADVYVHEFEYYARQFNWAIDHADIKTGWTLRLDADERFTENVIREALPLLSRADVNGVAMESLYYFLERPIRHGITKKRKIMLFRTGIGRIEDRKRDAHTVLSEGKSVSIRARFLHRDFKDLSSHIARYNWYATRELVDYAAHKTGTSQDVNTDPALRAIRRRKFGLYYRAPRFLRCKLWFFYNYVLRLGFLDGREGYLYHYFECDWYRTLVDAKILEYEMTGALPEKLRALD